METSTVSRRAPGFSNHEGVEIIVAPNAGACFGVVRAIRLGERAVEGSARVWSLGPLIHNPQVVSRLEARGVRTVQTASEISEGVVLLRSHGIPREDERAARDRGLKIVDATCPLVKKPQRIAAGLGASGRFLVLVGDPNHPEVRGVLSYFARPDFLVTYDPKDIDRIPADVQRVGVLAQTTIEYPVLEAIEARCRERFSDVTVHNTICDATSVRQSEAADLSASADVMIVVGGRNSSNTKKLEKICLSRDVVTHLVEEIEELRPEWFVGKRRIGVTGGASTPQDYVDRVGDRIADMVR